MKIIEVNVNNENKYLNQIANLDICFHYEEIIRM